MSSSLQSNKSLLPNSMPSNKSLAWGVAGETAKKLGWAIVVLFKFVLGIFIILGCLAMIAAPMKILLREKFGRNTLKIGETLTGGLYFIICGFLVGIMRGEVMGGIERGIKPDPDIWLMHYYFNPTLLFIVYLSLLAIGLAVIVKGIELIFKFKIGAITENLTDDFPLEEQAQFENKEWQNINYRGDSLLYKKHIKDYNSLFQAWSQYEPDWCISRSIILLFIHPLLGGPLLLSSFAFKLNEAYHVRFKWKRAKIKSETSPAIVGITE